MLSWKTILRIISVLSLFIAAVWAYCDPGFEPVLALLGAIVVFITSFFTEGTLQRATRLPYDINSLQNRRNRQIVLQNIKNAWIKGVLENSLQHAIYIELGKEYKPEAVQRTWSITLHQSNKPGHQISDDTKIIDVFKGNGRSLLILGEPGSGKTITLLQLARDLIAKSEQDELEPIPLVFNLSSWVEKKQPLEEWLIEELSLMYQVPHKIGRAWIAADQVTLLLDGLDEVKREYREDCVTTINQFRQEHMVDMVVCSRLQDYEELTTCLNLQAALTISPLNRTQIDLYLASGGKHLAAARIAVNSDALLLELAQSPLNLNIIALVYRARPLNQLAPGSLSERRSQLFTAYVERMFEHRRLPEPFAPNEITRRLGWLAYQMLERSKTFFYIEHLQPDWLPFGKKRQAYEFVVKRVVGLVAAIAHGTLFGIGMGIFFTLATDLPTGIAASLVWSVGYGIIIWLGSFGVPYKPEIWLTERVSWSWERAKRGLFLGVFGGLLFALVIGTLTVLVSAIITGLRSGLILGTRVGLFAWIILGLLFGQSSWKNDGLVFEEVLLKTKPNQGIWLSLRNSMRICLFSGIFDALFTGILGGAVVSLLNVFSGHALQNLSKGLLGYGWQEGLYFGLGFGFYFGAVGMISGWWNGGGRTFIRHFVLRYLLVRGNLLPWELVNFLDIAVAHILLRKAGGGYIFVHRMIQEYFATLYQNSDNRGLELEKIAQ